jgi:hypothetical protein
MPNNCCPSQHAELLWILLFILVVFNVWVNTVYNLINLGEALIYTNYEGWIALPEETIYLENLSIFLCLDLFYFICCYFNPFGQCLVYEITIFFKKFSETSNKVDEQLCRVSEDLIELLDMRSLLKPSHVVKPLEK